MYIHTHTHTQTHTHTHTHQYELGEAEDRGDDGRPNEYGAEGGVGKELSKDNHSSERANGPHNVNRPHK